MYTQYSAGGRPRSLSLHVIHRYPHSESRSFVDLQVPIEHASCSSRSVGVVCTMRVCPPSICPCISMRHVCYGDCLAISFVRKDLWLVSRHGQMQVKHGHDAICDSLLTVDREGSFLRQVLPRPVISAICRQIFGLMVSLRSQHTTAASIFPAGTVAPGSTRLSFIGLLHHSKCSGS